tara:strand:+ start:4209 stop:4862 length:654 start_codon:yes stop_codon:yes gene_type:complete
MISIFKGNEVPVICSECGIEIENPGEQWTREYIANEFKWLIHISTSIVKERKENSIIFHSRSKDQRGKLLSNFSNMLTGIKIFGQTFYSVENAFQAIKFLYSSKPKNFKKLSNISPKEAKKMGTKTYYKKNNVTLNIDKWNNVSQTVMEHLINLRYVQDVAFSTLVKHCNSNSIELFHFERSGEKSYWGGYFSKVDGEFYGKNKLGNIIMNLSPRPI